MKVFILVRKDDDYSALPDGSEPVFIFDAVTNYPNISDVMTTLGLVLDSADAQDRIIFNGPSWLIAIAGYIWLSQNRENLGILVFDNKHKTYVDHNYAYAA